MQKGREKSAATARRNAVTRVVAFREWLTKDAEYSRQLRQWTEFGFPMEMKRKPQPPTTGIPSDNDYKIAREEGAI
jgi:hypothetical protein